MIKNQFSIIGNPTSKVMLLSEWIGMMMTGAFMNISSFTLVSGLISMDAQV